jgi:hypothetical protein
MRKQEEDWRVGAGPWWDVGDGWRVHVGLDEHFCWCYNRRSGEVTDWTSLRLALYGETPEGFERLVRDAIAAGRRGGTGPGVEVELEL